MVGTRALTRLVDRAASAGAKVVLVGDPCQLPEIEAGGALRGLQGRLGASVLAENRRQCADWERDALTELRAGDADRAFDEYVDHGRVHRASSDRALRDRLVERWLDARFDGHDALMVAARRVDIDDLNRRARAALRDEYDIGEDEVVLGGRLFATGDAVLARRNDYRLGVLNGTRATVERIDTTRHELALRSTDGQLLVVPFDYAVAGHITHGYATTVHQAQGATVDRCFVLVDDAMSREHAYTALSRGRHGNELFVLADEHRAEERHAAEVTLDPLDAVRRVFGRSAEKLLAIDEAVPARRPAEDLRAEHEAIHRRIGDGPPDVSREYRRLIEDLGHEKRYLEGAEHRLDRARSSLEHLGPIRRRTHPAERRDLEERITRFTAEADRHGRRVGEFEAALDELTPSVLERTTWEREHQPDLDRLGHLDRQIDLARRLEATVRTPERTVDHDLGISL